MFVLPLGMRERVQSEWAVSSALYTRSECGFVWGENTNAFPPARDSDVPLLGVCGSSARGVGEEDVFDGLALRAVGGDGVASDELPEGRRDGASVVEHDGAVRFDFWRRTRFHRLRAYVRRRRVRLL